MYEIPYHTTSLEDKTILITGAAGFIGSNIVEYLLKHQVKKVIVLHITSIIMIIPEQFYHILMPLRE